MLLKEQIHSIYKGLSQSCSTAAFQKNARALMKKGLPKSTAFSLAYSVLAWACEKAASSARDTISGKSEDCNIRVLGRLLKPAELEEAEIYSKYLALMEGNMERDPLMELAELDRIMGKTLIEQRPAVADVAKAIDSDLQKMALVSLARMMHAMGYERWPHDKEGQEDIKKVIDAIHKEMVRVGRNFAQLTKRQMSILRSKGPKNYERIIGKWLRGEPEEFAGTEIDRSAPESAEEKYEDGDEPEQKKTEPEKSIEPKKMPVSSDAE